MTTPPVAVLWDMDGTLVDTEPYWIAAEYEIVESFGGTWSDEHAHTLIGSDLIDSGRYIAEHGGVPLSPEAIVDRLLDGVIARMSDELPWRPGATELLRNLSDVGVPCALVTMSWSRVANAVVSLLPRNTFAAVVTGDMVTRGKPHPEPYLTAAHLLDVDPRQCIALEDSPTGTAAARAAGCRTIAIPHVVEVPHAADLHRVGSLTDLDITVLRSLFEPGLESSVVGD